MRIVFAGTPQVAVPTLRALVGAGHEVILVVTREDAPIGRKRTLTASPVAKAADEFGLRVLKSNRITAEQTAQVLALQPDVGVVVAFGALLKPSLLEVPSHGWLNIHFSLLPRWRGAAPVQHALLAGDSITGVTIFRLDEGLDTGDVLAQQASPLHSSQPAGEVLNQLAESAPTLLLSALEDLAAGRAQFHPQVGESSNAPKLSRDDAKLDFTQAAERILNRWAAVTPEPGAHCLFEGGSLKILDARATSKPVTQQLRPGECMLIDNIVLAGTSTAPIELVTLQPAGKSAMSASDWLRGRSGSVTLS